MNRSLHETVSILLVCLLIFSSLPIKAAAVTPTLTIQLQTDGQPYNEGEVATSPVTMHVTTSSSDSATVQISQDLGETWQPFDVNQSLTIETEGTHHIWLQVIGQSEIEKRQIRIAPFQNSLAMLFAAATDIIYVNVAAIGANNGTSWANAYTDLQSALTQAVAGKEIWVAKGTYTPTTGTNRAISFQMKNGVAIYGGFAGIEQTRDERNVAAYKTILSGDIGTENNIGDNSYHVFYHGGLSLDNTAILDGVTITGGNANAGGGNNEAGAGMYNENSSPTLTNVTFIGNKANTAGGAMYNENSNPILTNVIFSKNKANSGGAMNNSDSNPIITNALFSDNTATSAGGSIHNWNSIMTLTNVTISGNETDDNKAVIHGGDATSKIRNSIIIGNNGPAYDNKYAGEVTNSLLNLGNNGAQLYSSKGHLESPTSYLLEEVFIDPTNLNYRLKAGSPAINKGNSSYPELVNVLQDLYGKLRIQGGVIDLGAYEAFPYMISYDANEATGGTVPTDKETYGNGDSVTVLGNSGQLEKTGYTFAGWNRQANGGGTNYAAGDSLTINNADVTLYAKWETIQYELSFDTDGGIPTPPPQMIHYNNKVTKPSDPTKIGFTFDGWYKDTDIWNFVVDTVMENTTLQAKWAVAQHIVSFEVDGDSPVPPSQTIDYNNKVTEPPIPTKVGYTFEGWYTEDTFTTKWDFDTDVVTEDTTLYAKWEVAQHTVTFNTYGGSIVQAQTVTYDTAVIAPLSPTRSGYTFEGWYKEPTFITRWKFATDTVKENRTLYAKWANIPINMDRLPSVFILSFETNGGSLIDNQVAFDNELIKVPPIPVKAGYTFDGWYKEPTFITKWDFATDHVTTTTKLYAKWIENRMTTPEPEPMLEPEEPTEPLVTFSDTAGHWANEMIKEIATQGIINGYPDGTFRPNEFIKRQHVVVMLARALELEPIREAASFIDVPVNHPYYEAIMKLQQAGIIDGSKGAFNPDEIVTRAQMAKILVGALNLSLGGTNTFKDVNETHWSYDYITALEREGIALGSNGYFNPNAPLTRAQFVALLYRAFH
ncbi:InlB B-repeat-containing protein [Lysinibacillus piscis]|uniref:SLH domain-containing protein n=1 Tax=Lysinibacillus piscis TaxID=2518931 RepID=A0ABQ5NJ16_9BACI|nr:InlB B-repeat-containing protein [Lysinibacillus sp. KH24]GLC88056.1 hypothetical protein LYSBPC_11830 [Lysinibacillus sp. KH24]